MVTDDCPFLSPKQLGLKPKERDALVKTLLLMENGQVKHVPVKAFSDPVAALGKLPFNMNMWSRKCECGTVCCIGGTAEAVGGFARGSMQEAACRQHELWKLFYGFSYHNYDPSEQRAAQVLRGYLTTGKTKW